MAPRNRKGGGGKGGGGGGGGRQGGGDSRRRADAKPQLLKWVAVAVASLWVGGALWWTMSEADVDRLSSIIDGAVPAGKPVTQENGAAIAEALDLRGLVQNIVETTPGASFISLDPPIVHFDEFMTGEECDAFIEAGKPGLQPSTGTGNLQANGKFERTKIEGRTSYNAWCMAPSDCPTLPIIRQIDLRIANITGFSYRNMEYYQILRYRGKQEYQVHSDWIDQQAAQPSGPRVFTFFLYLNDIDEEGEGASGGATWFPQAKVNESSENYWRSGEEMNALHSYYAEYNTVANRKRGFAPPSQKFKDIGLRAVPKRGTAIMWPNVHLDNVYVQNPGTMHAAEELLDGHVKWAANAWIHLRDFRTPHGQGLTG